MERLKQIKDHSTIRPVLQQDAAKRMIRGGLYDFQSKNEDFRKKRNLNKKININENQNAANRKRKFIDD